MKILICGILFCLATPAFCQAECIDFTEARKHIGETRCITGKVVRVEQGAKGVHYLDFCDDYRLCPFTVVVFASDLKHVGDVRELSGKIVEVHGPVKDYDNRAEIVLQEARQLTGEASRIPPLPKTYDVEQKGKYSAGTYHRSKTKPKTGKKRQPVQMPIEIPEDDSD